MKAWHGVLATVVFWLIIIAVVALCGCVAVTATRTTTINGVPITETIKVQSFLESISDGTYSTTNGMVLSTTSATPDQQSIATLAGVVGDLGKAAMLLAKQPTNTVSTISK
jgi:hypothetical protein